MRIKGLQLPTNSGFQSDRGSLVAAGACRRLRSSLGRIQFELRGGESRARCFRAKLQGDLLGGEVNGRRHHQATHGQGLRVYRHRERQGLVFSLVRPRRGELRTTPRRTTGVIHRRIWTERAKSRERQAGLTELRETCVFSHGEAKMGDKGSKDKAKREQRKKPKLTPKEKRKLKKDKKNN